MDDNNIETINKDQIEGEEEENLEEIKNDENIEINNHDEILENNNIESEFPNVILPEKTKEQDKKLLITETYLQNKYDDLNIPKKLKKVVSQGLNKTNEKIYDDISQNNLNIKSTSENINLLLQNLKNSKIKLPFETIKTLKNLKLNEEQIMNSIHKLDNIKKIIIDESQNGLKGGIIEENIKKSKLKEIEGKIEELNNKLYNIFFQIEKITEVNKPSKKEILNNFYDNFEKDKEIYREKAKKYYKNSLDSKRKLLEDKKITSERREKILIEKEKEENERKEKLLIEKNEKERQNILKRKKEIDEKLEKTKQYINEKNHKSEKDYLYYKNKEKFETEEQKYLDKEKHKKKEFITKEEIKELDAKIKKQKKNFENEEKEKTKLLHEMWNDRNQIVQSYKTNISVNLENEEKKKKEEEIEKKTKKKELELLKLNYSNKSIPKPKINEKLRKNIEERKNKIDKESVLNTQNNNKKRLEIFHLPSPKKRKIDSLPNISEEFININVPVTKSAEFSKLLFNKPKKLKPIRLLHPKPERPIDYLEEFRKKNASNQTYKKKVSITLDENDKTRNIYQKIKLVQDQAYNVDNKVKMKQEEMKMKGGYIRNLKIGDEIGDMLIQSIEAKINIMNKLNENGLD